MNKRIIALDIGTKLGVYHKGKKADTIQLGDGDSRFLEFWKLLNKLIDKHEADVVTYEAAAFQHGFAIPIYHGLIGILKIACMLKKVEHQGIPVGTVKKCFTGKGNCNKAAMMARCDELGIKYDDDNSADAYGVYYTYVELYGDKK